MPLRFVPMPLLGSSRKRERERMRNKTRKLRKKRKLICQQRKMWWKMRM